MKAAENGDTSAEFFLGVMYLHGEGLERDYDQAVNWISKAAIAGDKNAIEALKELKIIDDEDNLHY